MSSSTSNSEVLSEALGGAPAKPAARAGALGGPRTFLAAMAGGVALTLAAVSLAPESYIHSGPEYGMSEALQDHIAGVCAAKAAPDLLILGDSRAVAGLAVKDIEAAGISAEKFALGGAGIFAGWATLDRLIGCGVRPKHVLLGFGTVNLVDGGAIMDRTTNYDTIQGPRRGYEYDMLSKWEARPARRLTYKAVSLVGPELSLVDFVLMRPALKTVLAEPPHALANHTWAEQERVSFLANEGDRYYGLANGDSGLPDEAAYVGGPHPENGKSITAILDMGKAKGFDVLFYVLPSSESGKAGVPAHYFEMSEDFLKAITAMGVKPLNDIWTLPDADFGDPSHVNPKGRAAVMADALPRIKAAIGVGKRS